MLQVEQGFVGIIQPNNTKTRRTTTHDAPFRPLDERSYQLGDGTRSKTARLDKRSRSTCSLTISRMRHSDATACGYRRFTGPYFHRWTHGATQLDALEDAEEPSAMSCRKHVEFFIGRASLGASHVMRMQLCTLRPSRPYAT